MSGFGTPRPPQRPRGPFSFNNPRFPPPQPFSTSFRPRHPQDNYFNRGFTPSRGSYRPRGRFSSPCGHQRPSFGNRGRSQGYKRNRGSNRPQGSGQEIEAYYKHSMVEDPWKELEEAQKKQNQKQESNDD